MATLNRNTVKAQPRQDGGWEYAVLDSVGRRQGVYGSAREAAEHAGRICRFGWPLELGGHNVYGACQEEHATYGEALSELASLNA